MYTFRLQYMWRYPLAFLLPLADSPFAPLSVPFYLLGTLLAVTGSVHPGPRLLINWPPLPQPLLIPSPFQIPSTQVIYAPHYGDFKTPASPVRNIYKECKEIFEWKAKYRLHIILTYVLSNKLFWSGHWSQYTCIYFSSLATGAVFTDAKFVICDLGFCQKRHFHRDFHLLSSKWSRWTNLHSHWSSLNKLSQKGVNKSLLENETRRWSSHRYILLFAWTETNKRLVEKIYIFITYKYHVAGTNPP